MTTQDLIAMEAQYRCEGEKHLAIAEKLRETIALMSGQSQQLTQREQLEEVLRKNGPMTTKEIDETGLPPKIRKNYLREEFFHKDEHGRWSLKEGLTQTR